MRKRKFWTAAALLGILALSACGGAKQAEETKAAEPAGTTAEAESGAPGEAESGAEELEVLKVGASPSPHAEILNAVKPALADRGYDLQVVEYTDYVQPNLALDSGELDANYFQHEPYLLNFCEERKTKLVSAGGVHYEPFGIYGGKSSDLENVAEGAKVAVPNDVTNEARALLLLADRGLITLKEGAGINATRQDIAENPKKLEIIEVEAAQIPRSLQDVDFGVINGNYALSAGLRTEDALAVESADSLAARTYTNVVAVREGEEESEKTKALMEALRSDQVRSFIEAEYQGAVVPSF